jgi:hypothetical protein
MARHTRFIFVSICRTKEKNRSGWQDGRKLACPCARQERPRIIPERIAHARWWAARASDNKHARRNACWVASIWVRMACWFRSKGGRDCVIDTSSARRLGATSCRVLRRRVVAGGELVTRHQHCTVVLLFVIIRSLYYIRRYSS